MFPNKKRNEYEPVPAVKIAESQSNVNQNRNWYVRSEGQRRSWYVPVGLLLVFVMLIFLTIMSPKRDLVDTHNESLGTEVSGATDDTIFSASLVDDQGFFFPTTATLASSREENSGSIRRVLAKKETPPIPNSNIWRYDWKENMEARSAVGDYYRGKGLAIQDYYRTKYDPTYKTKTSTNVDPSNSTTTGTSSASPSTDGERIWSYDWELDKDRGVAIGELYIKIGEAIEEHYRYLFDPTYDDDGIGNETQHYDWEADRERGMALAQYYISLGKWITEHYKQEYLNSIDDPTVDANRIEEFNRQWKEYKKMGEDLAKYYHDKGVCISKYYKELDDIDKFHGDDTLSTSLSSDESIDDNADNPEVDQYVWGLDWVNDKDHAMKIHKEWMERGIAIGDYYRSKYDPTYVASAAASNAEPKKTLEDIHEEFPPWGVNPTADKEHGKAIGQFYKKRGKAIGKKKKKEGKKIGKHYEDYYRKIFDPTYNATEDLNW